MEYVNKVTLHGIVGNIRVSEIGGGKLANLSVYTESVEQSDGQVVINSEWHNVVAWQSEESDDMSLIRKGDAIQVEGRLRTRRYTREDGSDSRITEIKATSVTKLTA